MIAGGLRLGANSVFAGGTNALVLSSATLDAGTYANAFDTLELLTNSVINVESGAAALSFSDCSAKTWTGTLTLIGKLGTNTLRFGTSNGGLSATQLACLKKTGGSLYLNPDGYLRQVEQGTLISVR